MNQSPWTIAGIVILLTAGTLAYQSVKRPGTPQATPQTTSSTTSDAPSAAMPIVVTSTQQGTTEPSGRAEAPTPTTVTEPAKQPQPEPVLTGPKQYTLAQVQTHNNASSCWTIVSGNVYDLTAFIGRHPGGADAVRSLCGKDGTSQFMDQHAGDGRPERTLTGLSIGVLVR